MSWLSKKQLQESLYVSGPDRLHPSHGVTWGYTIQADPCIPDPWFELGGRTFLNYTVAQTIVNAARKEIYKRQGPRPTWKTIKR